MPKLLDLVVIQPEPPLDEVTATLELDRKDIVLLRFLVIHAGGINGPRESFLKAFRVQPGDIPNRNFAGGEAEIRQRFEKLRKVLASDIKFS